MTTSCILEEDCMILGHQLSTEAEAYPELSRLTFAALKQRCCNTRLPNQGSSVWRVMTQIAVADRGLFLAWCVVLGILKHSGMSKHQTQFHGRPTKAWSLVTANDNQLHFGGRLHDSRSPVVNGSRSVSRAVSTHFCCVETKMLENNFRSEPRAVQVIWWVLAFIWINSFCFEVQKNESNYNIHNRCFSISSH